MPEATLHIPLEELLEALVHLSCPSQPIEALVFRSFFPTGQ